MVFRVTTSPEALLALTDLIAQRTGLHLREADRAVLAQTAQARCRALGLAAVSDYTAYLAAQSPSSEQEWSRLAARLTNIESYFFRDRGQFQLLEQGLLPELIARQRPQRRLRLWSAGCSTGEEPYSLAMLLLQLLPDLAQWDCRILATDFNPEALARARRGWYSNWSFRVLPADYRQRYFEPVSGGYQISALVQPWVEFHPCNLVEPLEHSPALRGQIFDLILCRNVFIYFHQAAIARTLAHFTRALRPEGYLLTGHAELYGQALTGFVSRIFPESIVYQRCGDGAPPVKPALPGPPRAAAPAPPPQPVSPWVPPSRPAVPAPLSISNLEERLGVAQTLFAAKAYRQAAQAAEAVLAVQPRSFAACELLAQIYANTGDYDRAIQYCHRALAQQPFTVAIYYLLAQIAEESSNFEEAKAIFKKIIYLEPDSSWAHYGLGTLYEREGDRKRACKMYASARHLLAALSQSVPEGVSPATQLAPGVDLTVADFQRLLAAKLDRC